MYLLLPSIFTLTILFGMVAGVVFGASLYLGNADLQFIILFTIGINFLFWLVSPFFQDLMQRWFYKMKPITLDELRARSTRSAALIEKVCQEYGFKPPKLRLIEDDNPTAYCYGSGRYNARLVITEGLFTYLAEDELEVVIAHEMGHIVRRDFILMTVASTLVQILYELYSVLLRRKERKNLSSGKKDHPLAMTGAIALVFYFIGTYLLLFLSRAREYGADEFAARQTGNPTALSRALVKIAYGIIAKPEDAGSQRLLKSTRALGIFDSHAAKGLGQAAKMEKANPGLLGKVMLFDFVSPWAKILEWSSTHPLTGKRILRLEKLSADLGQAPYLNLEKIQADNPVDQAKMNQGFWTGVLFYFAPHLAVSTCLVLSFFAGPFFLALIPAALGAGILLRVWYKYPKGEPRETTVLAEMANLYASPMRGQNISLQGTVIGKGQAGAYLSEDVMLQDQTGLIYLNYESAIPVLGNFIAALGKIKKLIGQQVKVRGWFFRALYHHLDTAEMETAEGKKIKSHPILWIFLLALLLIGISVVCTVVVSQDMTSFYEFGVQ